MLRRGWVGTVAERALSLLGVTAIGSPFPARVGALLRVGVVFVLERARFVSGVTAVGSPFPSTIGALLRVDLLLCWGRNAVASSGWTSSHPSWTLLVGSGCDVIRRVDPAVFDDDDVGSLRSCGSVWCVGPGRFDGLRRLSRPCRRVGL